MKNRIKKIKEIFWSIFLVLKYGPEALLKDALTGCYRRITIPDMVGREINLAKRYEYQIYIIVLDLDGLKKINEKSHKEGDIALKRTVKALKSEFRKTDIIIRPGGDEFIVFLPNAEKMTPIRIVKNSLKKLKKYNISFTAEIGCWDRKEKLEELINRVDERLMKKKNKKKTSF